MIKTELFELFSSHKNDILAKKMAAYMRNQFDFLGIMAPKRKELCKPFWKASQKEPIDWAFIKLCWTQKEREFQYVALDYLSINKNKLVLEDFAKLKKLAITKSWWDSIDGLDTIIGSLAFTHPKLNQKLIKWSLDENIWLRRISIDHQRMRKAHTDTKLLDQIIKNNLNHNEFFINKAIGWALREYSKTDSAWVADFIKQNNENLSSLSKKEASKYLR